MKSQPAEHEALAFERMSEYAREKEVVVVGTSLMILDGRKTSVGALGFEELAEALLKEGRLEQYNNFDANRRLVVIHTFFSDTPIETLFLLDDIKPGMEFTRFIEDRSIDFEGFESSLRYRFGSSFQSFGTDEFLESLHNYFETFGGEQYSDLSGRVVSIDSRADEYMMLAAFSLREVYGEEKVMTLVDRMVRENSPIPSIEFITLIKSTTDYSNYPINWARNLI